MLETPTFEEGVAGPSDAARSRRSNSAQHGLGRDDRHAKSKPRHPGIGGGGLFNGHVEKLSARGMEPLSTDPEDNVERRSGPTATSIVGSEATPASNSPAAGIARAPTAAAS